jgi:hypothetical protein
MKVIGPKELRGNLANVLSEVINTGDTCCVQYNKGESKNVFISTIDRSSIPREDAVENILRMQSLVMESKSDK